MVRVLSVAGFDVRETATGRDALRLARLSPGAIVLDIALQDMDGFEVCRLLKADTVTSGIPGRRESAAGVRRWRGRLSGGAIRAGHARRGRAPCAW